MRSWRWNLRQMTYVSTLSWRIDYRKGLLISISQSQDVPLDQECSTSLEPSEGQDTVTIGIDRKATLVRSCSWRSIQRENLVECNVNHLEAPVRKRIYQNHCGIGNWANAPDDRFKGCQVSKVYHEVEIDRMEHEYHAESREDPRWMWRSLNLTVLLRQCIHEDRHLEKNIIFSNWRWLRYIPRPFGKPGPLESSGSITVFE